MYTAVLGLYFLSFTRGSLGDSGLLQKDCGSKRLKFNVIEYR